MLGEIAGPRAQCNNNGKLKMGNKQGQSNQLALFIVLEMCLEDGNVPIDAPSPFCSVHRVFSVPFNPLCVLQDLNGFSMTRPRPVTFDLVRRKIDVTHGPEILNPSAIDGDRFVVQHAQLSAVLARPAVGVCSISSHHPESRRYVPARRPIT